MADTLPTLPPVQFVDTDAQAVVSTIMQAYTAYSGRTLADGDPLRQVLLGFAYVIALQRTQTNDAALGNLLHYGRGAQLDYIGVLRKTPRLQAEAARDRLRFTLSASRLVPTVIPAGTRVTADNQLYWQTTQALTIPAAQTKGVVPCVAMTAGAIGNAAQPGDLTSLIDPVAYVVSVTNLDGGQGGRDEEGDDAYRFRLYMAPAEFSVAGPEDAYKSLAYGAHASIADVVAFSPDPGVAKVVPLLEGGVIPGPAILDAVESVLRAEKVRPLCDSVEVAEPDAVAYNITATWYLPRAQQALQAQVTAQVQQAQADYVLWQKSKLGRDIDPGELNARVRAAGAKRIVITSPVFTALEAWEVAQEGTVALTFGGVEDE